MSNKKLDIKSYFSIILGCFIMTVSMNMFLIPFRLAPGGVSGLSTVLYYVLEGSIPVGTLMLILNTPLFIIGYRSKGRQFLIRSLFGATLLSLMIDSTSLLFSRIINEHFIRFDNSMSDPDLLLYALIGGGIMGFGLAIVLREEATTGGTDLMAAVLHKLFRGFQSANTYIYGRCNYTFATIVFRSVKLGLYASMCLYVSSKTIDAYLEGVRFSKAFNYI